MQPRSRRQRSVMMWPPLSATGPQALFGENSITSFAGGASVAEFSTVGLSVGRAVSVCMGAAVGARVGKSVGSGAIVGASKLEFVWILGEQAARTPAVNATIYFRKLRR